MDVRIDVRMDVRMNVRMDVRMDVRKDVRGTFIKIIYLYMLLCRYPRTQVEPAAG